MTLLNDIDQAERANQHVKVCKACSALGGYAPGSEERVALERALSGTIGTETLASILAKNGFDVGRRAIERHRREEHGNE